MPNTENHSPSTHLGHSFSGYNSKPPGLFKWNSRAEIWLNKSLLYRVAKYPNNSERSSQCKQWYIRELQFHHSYPFNSSIFSVVAFKHLYNSTKPHMHYRVSKAQRHLCLIRQRHIRFQEKIDSRCDPLYLSIKNNVS